MSYPVTYPVCCQHSRSVMLGISDLPECGNSILVNLDTFGGSQELESKDEKTIHGFFVFLS